MKVAIYIAAITAANLLVYAFGPWFSPINSLLLIGLDLSLRDKLHDQYGIAKSIGIVAIAGVISYAANPAGGMIAIASVVAFVFAGIADSTAYQSLKDQSPLKRMNGSNVVGAAVDSILFPTIAFGALMPHIVVMQFLAKVIGGAGFAYVLTRKSA